jgi:hypothetical protein
MEAREIGKTLGGWQRFFWPRGRSPGEAVFQKEIEVREIGKTPGGWQRFLV